ncbi:MAG: cytochrome c [Sphingobacteriales bacterium]|nr:MAG: cytochrome c [Sphingobacteriales bacterium]
MSLMKKIIFAASVLTLGLGLLSCGGAHGNDPGHAYMPDMYYARAYEAYGYNMVEGELDSLRQRGILYNGLPVPGTVAREDMLPYHLAADSNGLKAANGLMNPMDTLSKVPGQLKEGERLYLVNCGICHGQALDGNGPLYKGGEGPYPVKPRNLLEDYTKNLTDGHIFHVITFGIRTMGSYASQLRPEQRWQVINYLRSKQGGGSSDSTTTKASQTNVNPTGQDSSKTK